MVSAFGTYSSYNNGNWGSRIDKAHAQGSRRLSRSAQGPWEEKGPVHACLLQPPVPSSCLPAGRLYGSGLLCELSELGGFLAASGSVC